MLEAHEIGVFNVNNDVGYYASMVFFISTLLMFSHLLFFHLIKVSCPPPLKPRDFVLQRSWLDTGPLGEQMLISRSVYHREYPPKKNMVRATSYITGRLTFTVAKLFQIVYVLFFML